MTPPSGNADAWGLPNVLAFFERERATTADVYPSEWFFLKDRLTEGMSVLDVGCAQGGFAKVLGEHLSDVAYTGVDINAEMIDLARAKVPDGRFLHVPEGALGALGDATFDLVLVLGILHLHLAWRSTLAAAWARTRGAMIFDLRQTAGETIEDPARSFFKMDFNGSDAVHSETVLPYIIVNAGEALATTEDICAGASRLAQYGYRHAVSGSAVSPVGTVMATTYCVER